MQFLKRTFKRLDVTSRSLIALIEPGSAFAGTLLELALACDRQYLLDGVFEDEDPEPTPPATSAERGERRGLPDGQRPDPARSPGSSGPARSPAAVRPGSANHSRPPRPRGSGWSPRLRTTSTWPDEIRIALEERASLSPDALTGMEANHRFVGPETLETKIFGRLTAWQNWIFIRPNASGPDGALRRYGSGQRAEFDHRV